jgi:tripartite-type tricarboxylate transporter receptor subunit TctC
VAKINADLLTALKDPVVLAAFDKLGAVPVGSSPQDFEAFMRAEAGKWGPILKQANVRIE